jgi:hypothetical protein
MSDIERTAAGLQMIIPGCERRTLPRSVTRVDEAGQGLLGFYRPPSLREQLGAARMRLCGRGKGRRHWQAGCLVSSLAVGGAARQ